jgi:hypothetical protein
MNLRTHKKLRQVQAHFWILHNAHWQRIIDKLLEPTPEDRERQQAQMAAFWETLEARLSWKVLPDVLIPHVAETANPEVMKAYNNMLLGELVEPTGITYLNEKDQAVSVPLDSDAGRHAVAMFTDFQEYKSDKKKYVVIKKTTGEIVGDFDELTDAEAMIDKAKRAKKQALTLL